MISVRCLTKSFAAQRGAKNKTPLRAVDNLSFSVSPGSIYGLLGPNGSGKTTTFRCVATLYKPDSGSVSVMDRDTVREARDVRACVGFLSSDIRLSGHQSCKEILELYGRINRLADDRLRERMESLSELFDLRSFWNRPVAKYSTGQRQRAALAVSVVHDPAVLLLDEPTNGLDILAAKAVWDFIASERKRGKTIILSTHSIDEAQRVSDRIGLILSGSLAVEGSPDELRESLKNDSLESAFYSLIARDKAEREGAHA